MPPNSITRCAWVSADSLYESYHDREWGTPERDDRALFEKLILDGFQAGLSWITILRKRENFRRAFDGFEPETIARYRPVKIEKLMSDGGIIRNRQKIEGTVQNARAYLELRKDERFSDFLWRFTDGKTLVNRFESTKVIPAKTPESEAMSKALMKRGFRFVGPTICYAFMQAIGMVNDHTLDCFRYAELTRAATNESSRPRRRAPLRAKTP
ncbi:MAG TPA: DNA-3-methyladenine glycosylase I [Candidatus Eisenbacteria bacterium]|nr:DNA-3-methyladenine glycosylase I [Candidatus Eisenbacteria bacterium]